jgi:arylsulfatase A-like enzyme
VKEKHEGYRTDIFFNEAMRYIEEQSKKDEPFFCYLATFSPHGPLIVPEEYSAPYEGKSAKPGYHGMVANVDENLGRLLAKLDELRIAEETLLIAMGDNGGTFGIDTWNAGMRGAKAKAYRGATRTYSFWRWPGHLEPGDRDQLTCHHDVLPTLASLTGASVAPDHREQLDGYDLCPLLEEDIVDWEGKDRMIVHHSTRWPDGGEASHQYSYCGVRWGKHHLMRQHPCDDPDCGKNGGSTICHLDRKRMADATLPGFYGDLQHYKVTEPGKWSLFDLASDPHEDRTIADAKPEVVERMAKHFEQWWAQFGFE